MRDPLLAGRWFQVFHFHALHLKTEGGISVFKKLKAYLTAPAEEKRLKQYAKIATGTFALAAIGSWQHVASLHAPVTWSVLFGVATAGAKAVFDLVEPFVLAWFTKSRAGA